MCVCAGKCFSSMYICAQRGQKKVLDILELDSEIVMYHHVGARKHIRVLCRSNKYSKLLRRFLSPVLFIYFFWLVG